MIKKHNLTVKAKGYSDNVMITLYGKYQDVINVANKNKGTFILLDSNGDVDKYENLNGGNVLKSIRQNKNLNDKKEHMISLQVFNKTFEQLKKQGNKKKPL